MTNRDADLSKIMDLLQETKQRAQTMRAYMLVYLIQCAIEEASDISKGVVKLPRQ
jgi:hypothetical protein